jgi:hypothetical protein
MRKTEYIKSPYLHAFPHLEKSSPRAFYHTDLMTNLEGVVLTAQSEKNKSVLERLLSDKTKTLKATIKALFDEISLRENLDSHILKKIDDDICRQHTYLMQTKNLKLQYSPDLAKNVYKQRMQLEDNVLELEKEKRSEYLECWRDLMFLKKYLLSSLKDYWDLIKKKQMLSYDASSAIQK